MGYRFALVGNPNCGKTTMFNELTGSTQYVGNWPGVTVEKKEGKVKRLKEDVKIVDLPGVYSLSPYTMEEIIARDYLIDEKPDIIINIVEATNLERNLYLTTQIMELGIPMVLALNMMDALESRGDKINIPLLEKYLGIPVVPTSASKGRGIDQLMEKALAMVETAAVKIEPHTYKFYDDGVQKYITEVEDLLKGDTDKKYNLRWASIKFLESDTKVREKINMSGEIIGKIEECQTKMEKEYNKDVETIIAENRYKFISNIIAKSLSRNESGGISTSDKIDRVTTNRFLGIPLFLLIMFSIFQITFGALGSASIDFMDGFINETIANTLTRWLIMGGASEWLVLLVINGILAGVGGIMVFVPQIMILFLFLSILEDSGYMARAAFVMDGMLRKIGLSGKAFIPMIMGFGCTVPAVMAARTLHNEKDRRLTIILTPFMSCGARMPIYALFAAAFFAKSQSVVIFSVYLLGIVVAIFSGLLLRKTILKGEESPFVMEFPPYRVPTVKSLLIHMWDKGKDFIKKAGTVIFAASVIIWFFQTFSFSLNMVENTEESIFGVIGSAIAPIFAPLGFGDWKSSVALLTGLAAKEAVVSTMGILYGIGEVGEDSVELATALQSVFTPLKAYSFMAFSLLYMPCVAAFAAVKREMNSWKWTLFAVGYQTGIAWFVAFIIFQTGTLIGIK